MPILRLMAAVENLKVLSLNLKNAASAYNAVLDEGDNDPHALYETFNRLQEAHILFVDGLKRAMGIV